MIVVGFDQAPRNIGWAYGAATDPLRPSFGLYQPGNFGDSDELLLRDVKDFAIDLVNRSRAEAMFFEQIVIDTRHVNLPVTYAQFAVVAGLMSAADHCDVPIYMVTIAKWRKRFLGRANAPKGHKSHDKVLKDMARKACADRGWLIEDHNVAEACGIWEYGLAFADASYRRRSKADTVRRDLAESRQEMQA